MAEILHDYTVNDLVDVLFKGDFDQADSILNQKPELVNQRFDMWTLGHTFSTAKETPLTALLSEAYHINKHPEKLAQALTTLKFLIDHGADVNKTEGTVVRPLTFAIETHAPSIVQALIDAGAETNYDIVGGYVRTGDPLKELTPVTLAETIPDEEVREEMLAALAGNLIIPEE